METKLSISISFSMLYSVVDHIYVSLNYLGVTKKHRNVIDPNFDKTKVKCFRVMGPFLCENVGKHAW